MEFKYKTSVVLQGEAATIGLGKKISSLLPNGSVVLLTGDLGSGKTTLVKGVAEGLHIDEKVLSPTFNIMKLYLNGERPLVHIDAYRLEDTNSDIGLDEFIGIEQGLTFIEWPMYIEQLIDKYSAFNVVFERNEDSRIVTIESNFVDVGGWKL